MPENGNIAAATSKIALLGRIADIAEGRLVEACNGSHGVVPHRKAFPLFGGLSGGVNLRQAILSLPSPEALSPQTPQGPAGMCAAKRKKKQVAKAPASPRRVKRWATFVRGPGRSATLVLLILTGFCSASYGLWLRVCNKALRDESYHVALEQVAITPQPHWIRRDVRAQAFRNAGIEGPLSLMDDDLAERIFDAFSLHPWVAKVHRVKKSHPARVEVALEYHRPVCMVAVKVNGEEGAYPVGVHGVWLPPDDFRVLQAEELLRYPLLIGIDTLPTGAFGESWGDVRVIGGAEIADALRDVWTDFNLVKIAPTDPSKPGGPMREPIYYLITGRNTRIRWGRAPSTEAPSELPVAEKIARLRSHWAKYGTLEGRAGPQDLDVHTIDPAPTN